MKRIGFIYGKYDLRLNKGRKKRFVSLTIFYTENEEERSKDTPLFQSRKNAFSPYSGHESPAFF